LAQALDIDQDGLHEAGYGLDDLGHTLAGEAARIEDALKLARQAEFDVAILDVHPRPSPYSRGH
jgi:hypothetical protein